MTRKRLLWQLVPSYVLVTFVALVAVTVYVMQVLHRQYERRLLEDLQARAALVASLVTPAYRSPDAAGDGDWDRRAARLSEEASARVLLLDDGGVVRADSSGTLVGNSLASQEDVHAALGGKRAHRPARGDDEGGPRLHVSVPVQPDGRTAGVVRLSETVTGFAGGHWLVLSGRLAAGALLVALISAAVSLYISRRISTPLENMTRATEHFARGDFSRRVPIPGSQELAHLADAMNWMAVQLNEKISTIQHQRNEQEAVLSSMVEGVLALDDTQRVLNINDSLARLLKIDPVWARNRSVLEVVRNSDLQRFIQRTLQTEAPLEDHVVIPGLAGEERHLHVHGTQLTDTDNTPIGALVVLNDVTRMRRLEGMRRDFVANVSHELKTPVTSIKGFVETLMDGALDDAETARRFLDIISRHADRLSSIIDDLLSLSRIEQESEQGEVSRSPASPAEVMHRAVEMCVARAEDNDIRIVEECGHAEDADINVDLMEQALVNLIVNAVKYSEPGSTVWTRCGVEGGMLWFSVVDEGAGIASEHLPRLFERFYRVDKARSREIGGTGLGLAIVKHIAQAHEGVVEVQSRVGRGSAFTIRIPRHAGESRAINS